MSPDRKVTAVVFDVGGVLLDWNPRHLYRKLIPDPAEMEFFLSTVCTPEWHDAHDRGTNMQASCAALARQWPAHAALTMAWCKRSEEMIGGPIPDGVRLLRRVIDSGLPCYALTNMEAETYPLRRTRYDFLGWFEGTVVSGLEGIAKPDREIYELLLERFSLDPASTLFVDDSPSTSPARPGQDRRGSVYRPRSGPVPAGAGGPVNAATRRRLAVRQRGSVAVTELDCSEMTIRRDLALPAPVFRHSLPGWWPFPVQRRHGHPWSAGHGIVPYLRARAAPSRDSAVPVQDLLRRPDVKRQAQSRRQPVGPSSAVTAVIGYRVPTAQVPDGWRYSHSMASLSRWGAVRW